MVKDCSVNSELDSIHGTIHVINPTSFLETLENALNKESIQELPLKDFFIREKKTKPLPGFFFPEKFPDCCEAHKDIMNNALDHFNRFPNCCEPHKRLNKASWFNKSDYYYVPIKILLTYIYTGHCIQISIDKPDWYKRITDYIEYTENSFGNLPEGYGPPVGAGVYVNSIKGFIEAVDISKDKKKRLLSYFDSPNEIEQCVEKIDINILINAYKEWLSIFPFDLSIFKHLKELCFKRTPILRGPGETNMYTGITKFSLITYEEMHQFLIGSTQMILKEINSLKLYQNNILGDPDKINLEVTIAKRSIGLKKLDTKLSSTSITYREIITDWLKDEKEFLNEITPVLKINEQKKSFIQHLLDGIIALQSDDERALCIRNLRNDGNNKEALFRDYFKTFFTGRFEEGVITAEEIKGDRYIDLKIYCKEFGEKIIEFKGWWNSDKNTLVEQTCGYLTDNHSEGYIFMINPNKKKSIVEDYKNLITSNSMQYLPDSWAAHALKGTQLTYFESKHKLSVYPKTLYHFVFNAYF